MIGKTRHADPNAPGTFGQGCGVLRHSPAPGSYRHTRYAPPSALAGWIQHFWVESWDLRGAAPQIRDVLPHPCVHLAFARGRTRIFGVHLGHFVRELQGADKVLGVKFRPGAFYPFLRKPVCSIANMSFPAQQVFTDITGVEEELLACPDDHGMVEVASRFMLAHLPPYDPLVEQACSAVEKIACDPSVTRVESLLALCGMRDRTLQRMFRRYVGASARWVVKRYRVYEALEQLGRGKQESLATLAQNLGYYDQAHFINDFKKLVGRSPAQYANHLN
jgi:AraC-like DNA-binding protein